ncbi:MAG TPA: glycosyltransferase [Acidimicrobiales bacterium]|nr:glycosyltransferase [Acidimicrobiales bacterium]
MNQRHAHRPGPSLSLVVPVFDEEHRVAERVPELLDFAADSPPGSELIVVDDGSTDATAQVVTRLLAGRPDVPARLLRRPHAGKGAAVAAGLAEATADYAGFCDVDLSTPLADLERVVNVARQGTVLAIGSRDVEAARLLQPESRMRELLGRTYNRLVRLTLTPGIRDTQCGAKVAHRALWRAILPWCREQGFAWDVEALAVACRLGIAVTEVPVNWSHDERSRVRVGRDGIAMALAVPRIARHLQDVPAARPMPAPVPARPVAGLVPLRVVDGRSR